jgi:hypothetical protein
MDLCTCKKSLDNVSQTFIIFSTNALLRVCQVHFIAAQLGVGFVSKMHWIAEDNLLTE